jgi:hypothetical protein
MKVSIDGWIVSMLASAAKISFFSFEPKRDLPSEIKASLKKSVNVGKRAQIYLIFLDNESKIRGRFLFGQRKAPLWAGFAAKEPAEDDESGP